MKIYLAADHRGFKLKEELKDFLGSKNLEVVDLNPQFVDLDDYPDVASGLAKAVLGDAGSLGIILCGSGAGADIASNKFKGIRSVLGFSAPQVQAARHDDNVNVLTLSADYMDLATANILTSTFIETEFDSGEERYVRRLKKIEEIEKTP